jgi:hypothetical protein
MIKIRRSLTGGKEEMESALNSSIDSITLSETPEIIKQAENIPQGKK